MNADYRTVIIPGSEEHGGWHDMAVTLLWVCPQCLGPRGEPFPGISYDGSRRLGVDRWENPCGHVDYYSAVRREAATPVCSADSGGDPASGCEEPVVRDGLCARHAALVDATAGVPADVPDWNGGSS